MEISINENTFYLKFAMSLLLNSRQSAYKGKKDNKIVTRIMEADILNFFQTYAQLLGQSAEPETVMCNTWVHPLSPADHDQSRLHERQEE